jgi:CDP-diacylglycerol--glycerol-3-phosphate 3-phosphatidyltransferase/cardiolipin synthase
MRQVESRRRWIIVVPNVLSTLRLILAGMFGFVDPKGWWLMILAAGLSDFADGFIARRFAASSWAGGLLDAIADKTFALIVLITFTADDRLDVWQTLMLLSRDFVVVFVAIYAAMTGRWHAFRKMPSRLFGKLTTASMFALFLIVSLYTQRDLGVVAIFLRGLASEKK